MELTAAFSGLAAGAALWLRRPDDWLVLLVRLRPLAAAERVRGLPRRPLIAVLATSALALVIPSGTAQLAAIAAACAAAFGMAMRRRGVRRAAATDVRAEVARVLRSTTAELRAGVDAAAALRAAVSDGSAVWAPVRAARSADVRAALESAAQCPGAEALIEAATAWHLADHTGAPLAAVLDRLADSIQAEVDLDREVAVEAGPARATGRVMAVLPAFGLGLGMLLGGNPLLVLVGTPLGVACLVAGLALACAGVWWIDRIVASVDGR